MNQNSTLQELDYFRDLVRRIDAGEDIDAGNGLAYSQKGWLRQIEITPVRWDVTPHGRRALE